MSQLFILIDFQLKSIKNVQNKREKNISPGIISNQSNSSIIHTFQLNFKSIDWENDWQRLSVKLLWLNDGAPLRDEKHQNFYQLQQRSQSFYDIVQKGLS